ncbi:MAG: sugar ABC transporter permease [Lachnospiraceae bacterium]|nr:sugar ABC transporter permease [Lachnospiraceae bacterium]
MSKQTVPASGRSLKRAREISFTMLVTPAFILLFVLTVVPILFSVVMSFFNFKFTQMNNIRFIGFGNFVRAFGDRNFRSAIWITIVQVVTTVTGQMLIGMGAALLLSREGRTIRILRSMYIVPMMITPIVTGMMFRMMFNADMGIFNYLLSLIGVAPVNWLGDGKMALITVIVTDIWLSTPFVTMILMAGVQSISPDYYEAAAIDGVSKVQQFFHITLPLMRPMILLALLFRIMDAIRRYDSIMAMTAGGPGTSTQTLNIYAYYTGFSYFNIGYSSSLSLIMLIIIFTISMVLLHRMKKED